MPGHRNFVNARNTTFSLRFRYPSSCGESICSHRIEGWKLKSKSASVFSPGRRLDRIAVASRRPGRSAIWAASSRVIASAAVNRSRILVHADQ